MKQSLQAPAALNPRELLRTCSSSSIPSITPLLSSVSVLGVLLSVCLLRVCRLVRLLLRILLLLLLVGVSLGLLSVRRGRVPLLLAVLPLLTAHLLDLHALDALVLAAALEGRGVVAHGAAADAVLLEVAEVEPGDDGGVAGDHGEQDAEDDDDPADGAGGADAGLLGLGLDAHVDDGGPEDDLHGVEDEVGLERGPAVEGGDVFGEDLVEDDDKGLCGLWGESVSWVLVWGWGWLGRGGLPCPAPSCLIYPWDGSA